MADNQINSYTQANTIDPASDLLLLYQNSSQTYKSINRNTYLGVSGTPADISTTQTLTNKTLTSPTISSPTLSGTITGTYTLGGTPTFPSSVATLTGTQTLTNKTLTSPTITSPTITNATITNATITNASITADTVAGFTTSNSGTIYGMSVSGGLLASAALAGQVNTAALQTNAVGGANLATSAITLGYAQITSPFAITTLNAYVDVTGLSVTVTVPSGGRNLKITAYAGSVYASSSAGSPLTYAIREGSTVLNQSFLSLPATLYAINATCIAYVAAPSAGSHTYKVSIAQANAGTMTVNSGVPAFATPGYTFILVELI